MTIASLAAPFVAALLEALIPAGYAEASRRAVTVDGEAAELTRHERADKRNAGPGGEHFSTLIGADGRLKGFARIDLDLAGRDLPSREEAQAIAVRFLGEAAPDLLPRLEIHWIEPHDEPIATPAGPVTLTGMKVKMRNREDGLWFWAIVGADRKVMVFERDIFWVTIPGHRRTEKWLHDSWLAEQGYPTRAS